METVGPIELAMAGVLLGALLGCLGLFAVQWLRWPRSDRITCLMCGRHNRLSDRERESLRAICRRCGQALYLAGSGSTQEHPPRR